MSLLVGCEMPLSGPSGGQFLELFVTGWSVFVLCSVLDASLIKEWLRQYGEG